MTFTLKLLSALSLALCFSAYSNAQQIDNSGNLINNNNWSGAVYGVDPGGCCASISGSGALYDTTTDTIMFSYATDTLTQTISLQQALGGTGIQVHGYNYSWDFRYISNNATQNDSLTFNVALRNSSGTILESQSYNYDALFSTPFFQYDVWVTASDTVTYANPYTDPQSITLSITGRDGGFWAGYYGPEVRNVSLSVNYSFDPCAADPLYSSSCPGYAEAYMAYLFEMLGWSTTPEPETEIAAIDYSLTPAATASAPEETTTGEVVVDAGGIEVSATGELQVPDGIPEEAREKKPVDMNLISRIVRGATDDSAALSVVNRSIESSMAEDANPDFSMTTETLAAIARQTEASMDQSLIDAMAASESTLSDNSSTAELSSSVDQQPLTVEHTMANIPTMPDSQPDTTTDSPQDNLSGITGNTQNDITFFTEPVTTSATTQIVNLNPDTVYTDTESAAADKPAIELVSSPLVVKLDDANTTSTETSKRDVSDNEAAGDRGIEDIATEPQDFGMYLARQLVDVQFYQTEAIYRDLEPVDNRRSLRMLSGANDRLHQEMVDGQYRRR